MKTLYIAATAFQLITILNIKVNMNAHKGDLIIHEKSIPNSHYIKDKLVESGLFDRIFLFQDYDSRLNSVFTGKNTFWQYINLVYRKHFTKLDINDFILGEGYVDLSKYDEAFCFNKKFLNIIDKHENIKINFIDEGVGSYTNGTIKASSKINKIYLYKPELAVYYEKYKDKFVTIPALDTKNIEFKNFLNKVWGYEEIVQFENNTIIIFDQPWRIVPKYFEKVPKCLKESFLSKTKMYDKYANDEKAKDFFVKTINDLQNKKSNVVVKMHPRSSSVMKQYYIDNGLSVMENTVTPWEIVFLNLDVDRICLVSMFSTVTLSLSIYFKETNIIHKSVFLYKLAVEQGNVEIPKEVVKFIEDIAVNFKSVSIIDEYDISLFK